MAVALVIALTGSTDSDAATASMPAALTAAPEKCPSARKAVRFYQRRYAEHEAKMGAAWVAAAKSPQSACPRYLAHLWQRKAYAMRVRVEKYLASRAYHWDYERWMPPWMIRLGKCEMGLDWSRRWGIYEGAFAFATTTWDGYRLPGYPSSAADATPRQQMMVVLRIARKLTVGIPWGCWRGPQHAWVRGGLPERGFYGG